MLENPILQEGAVLLLKQLGYLTILVTLDLLLGSAVAIKEKQFQLEKLPEFLADAFPFLAFFVSVHVLAMSPALLGLELTPEIETALEGLVPWSTFTGIALKYIASIAGHIITIQKFPVGVYKAMSKVGVNPTGSDKPQG